MVFLMFQFAISALEDVVKSHPLVLEAVVVVEPHSSSSRELAAFVVKTPDSALTADDLFHYVKGILDLINKIAKPLRKFTN